MAAFERLRRRTRATVASLARAAADAAAEAEAHTPGGAIPLHERAARAYVRAAKRVEGPPRTALLAIGEGRSGAGCRELRRPAAPEPVDAPLSERRPRPSRRRARWRRATCWL